MGPLKENENKIDDPAVRGIDSRDTLIAKWYITASSNGSRSFWLAGKSNAQRVKGEEIA